MARKSGSTITQEELYPPSAPPARQELDDARLVDLDVDEESPFLRAQKRVPARRGPLPKKTAHRLLWAFVAVTVLCVLAIGAGMLYHYGERSWRFRIESSDNIDVAGMENVTKAQIMEVMGADIGRNIFFIPLAQQKAQLEQIPWVESASVMRFVPNRLRVEIHERTPVAFARVGPRIFLIDAGGSLMELPQKRKFSFPVILGMNPGEPLSTRIPRMKAYNELVRDLDSGGARYAQDLSEVDLSDLENIKVRVNDPHGDVEVELGSTDFLRRYKTYVSHVQEWRQQFQKLESVNLRYDNQVIVNPDVETKPRQASLSASAARAASAAGVKPAALLSRINLHDKSLPKPAFELSEKKLEPTKTVAVKNTPARVRVNKAVAKATRPAPPKKQTAWHAAAKRRPAAIRGGSSRSDPKKPAHAAVVAHGIPKPSPAISKQNTGSN
jgi:cell division protein FtsQ